MTCKDCLHYKVCEALESNSIPLIPPNQCGCFETKSRFVELPCNVGDTVYVIGRFTHSITEWKVAWITVSDDDMILVTEGGVCNSVKQHIGKTVFLTQEEAEQALKERENHEKAKM